ncbi:hypothetical protein GCK72_015316 [Caenorhabditis remanei]|uniref:Uncharacterized protein n=1 Tax=Caenorhabditis remanei TaxID=31234 RepID=A0A6A5GW67_CAERE|nr:hypothetical protein GCK72_015316 [Caenorhabditis remanei]KAF1758856.1 hypothetical protein GCK72_015316 [Caenorhabditis remanei]
MRHYKSTSVEVVAHVVIHVTLLMLIRVDLLAQIIDCSVENLQIGNHLLNFFQNIILWILFLLDFLFCLIFVDAFFCFLLHTGDDYRSWKPPIGMHNASKQPPQQPPHQPPQQPPTQPPRQKPPRTSWAPAPTEDSDDSEFELLDFKSASRK